MLVLAHSYLQARLGKALSEKHTAICRSSGIFVRGDLIVGFLVSSWDRDSYEPEILLTGYVLIYGGVDIKKDYCMSSERALASRLNTGVGPNKFSVN